MNGKKRRSVVKWRHERVWRKFREKRMQDWDSGFSAGTCGFYMQTTHIGGQGAGENQREQAGACYRYG